MKVLLINPPIKNIISLELPLLVRQNEGIFSPLGLMYIASYLKKYLNCQVGILDTLAEKMNYDGLEQYVRNYHPDIVGITTYTHNLIDVIITAAIIKKIDSRIHVCLGGPHVNVFPEESINISSIDFVVLSEGEVTFTELIRCLQEKSDLKKVKGLLFKQGGKSINAGLRENIVELDCLPFPDRGLLDPRKYSNILSRKSIVTTMISSRGCPYRCSFCSTPKGEYRMRSPENVVDEMEECNRLAIEEIHFVDDTFNVDIERVIRICNEINKRKLKIKWSFRGRIDKITEILLKKVKAAGCYRIYLGVETSTDEGLERLKKGITVEQIKQVFKWTRNFEINTVAYFLLGCPHEKNWEDIIKTIDFSKELNPDFALFNILTLYPGTELYEEGARKGLFRGNYWREFALNPQRNFEPEFWQEWLSKEELRYLLNRAYRQFYLRPKFLLRTLNDCKDLKVLAKRLKTGLKLIKLS